MHAMNRLALWTTLVLLGLAVAIVRPLTDWTPRFGPAALAVSLGLFGGSIALFVAVLIAGIRDRRWIVAHSSDARGVLAQASRGVRWGSTFAIGFCLLLFANCTGNVTSSSTGQLALILDPTRFWTMTAVVLAPLLLALLMPAVLTSLAERLATSRPHTARTLGTLASLSMVAVFLAVLLTVVIGFLRGISSCDVGPSIGYCAAGAGSMMNLFSIGSLALLLPYLVLVSWALAQIETTGRPGAPLR
ncbi:MAG: hypothetical protein PVS3B2_11980 [Candidatus Dormibacteraceae bacterium]